MAAAVSIGVDVIEIEGIKQVFQRHGERFLRRVYTAAEIIHCRGRVPELAARFAAKEAVSKALGMGIVGREGIFWREVEVLPDARGKPLVHLHGRAKDRAEVLGLKEFAISLSHPQEYAKALCGGHIELCSIKRDSRSLMDGQQASQGGSKKEILFPNGNRAQLVTPPAGAKAADILSK